MKKTASLFFLLFLVSFSTLSEERENSIFVSKSVAGDLIYAIDDRKLTVSRLSDYFNKNKDRWDKKAQLSVMLKKNMTFEDFFLVKGTLQGIGFVRVEYLVYSSDSSKAVQIQTTGGARTVRRVP